MKIDDEPNIDCASCYFHDQIARKCRRFPPAAGYNQETKTFRWEQPDVLGLDVCGEWKAEK